MHNNFTFQRKRSIDLKVLHISVNMCMKLFTSILVSIKKVIHVGNLERGGLIVHN